MDDALSPRLEAEPPWIDPELVDVLASLPPAFALDLADIPAARARLMALLETARVEVGPPSRDVTVSDHVAAGPDGPVPIRLYRPAASDRLAALLWLHGGGYVL